MTTPSLMSILQPHLERLQLSLSVKQAARLENLQQAMLQDPFYPSVSKISDPTEIAEKHFLDSLAPLHLPLPCWKPSRMILDLGTGAGFPALPLAVFFPDKQIIAVDSRAKAVDFVARMTAAVGLTNVKVIHARAEELGRERLFRGKSDLVVCRALSAIRVLVELTTPLLRSQGFALYYKGPKLDEELAEAAAAMTALRIDPGSVHVATVKPPLLPFERGYVLLTKTHPTPEIYPRRNGLPASKPL
jgi:16S rRNA (guanine527-N7)-methyltransferase